MTRRIPQSAALLFGVLLLAGVLVRLYAAWCLRHNLNLDAGVVTLMAKHIAEGKAFPVFFYGQAHMGSLEALFSGLFCFLFGISGFAVCLGTAFVAFWIMPIVYLWAKDAAGRMAGYVAMAFVVIGPGGFFHYNASPRGGYAAALTLGAFLLWYATRMAIRWAQERQQTAKDFFLLGIGAGLAWWSSQLTTAAILSAALLLLFIMRQAIITRRLFAGVFGFLLGSLPFWIYNLAHGWPSFAFTGTFGRIKFTDGLKWFFVDRFQSLMLPGTDLHWLRHLTLAAYIVLTLFCLFLLVRSARAKTKPLFISLLGILLFAAIFSCLFASAHFAAMNTPRYFLPMVAPLAVLLGIATAESARKLHPAIALLPLLLLITPQVTVLPWAASFEKRERAQMEGIEQLAAMLDEKGLDTLYARNIYRSWNFALGERILVVDLLYNFYLPHSQQAERTNRFGILNKHGDFLKFLRIAGGSFSSSSAGGYRVAYDIRPPETGWREIPPSEWLSATDADGHDVRVPLTDGKLQTFWERPPLAAGDPDDTLVVTFKKPTVICGFRMVAAHPDDYPGRWSAEGQTVQGDWIDLIKSKMSLNRFFWSGPRPFWGGPAYRMEARFRPQEITRLRIVHRFARHDIQWSLHTLQFFSPEEESLPGEEESLSALLNTLRARGIRNVYADRWAATQIDLLSGGEVLTTLDPEVFADRPHLSPDRIVFSDNTALLARTDDANSLRRSLSNRSATWAETGIGPWILFDHVDTEGRKELGLSWAGFTAMQDEARWATLLFQEARGRMDRGLSDERTLELIEEALASNPMLYGALTARVQLLREMGRTAEAHEAEKELLRISEPPHAASIRYAKGLQFVGYALSSDEIRPDASFKMTYHWAVPANVDLDHLAVFVHFRRDRTLFQDDHPLMRALPRTFIKSQTGRPLISVEREIDVPSDIPPGPIDIVLGVYDTRTLKRLRPRTDLPVRQKSVILPAPVVIAATPGNPENRSEGVKE